MTGRVVVVGRGEPERGGIPSYLAMMVRHQEGLGRPVVLVNLAPPGGSSGGTTSWANVRRTVQDAWRVWRATRRGDVVHVHSALAPTVTAVRAGSLLAVARLRGARAVLHAHGGRLAQQPPRGVHRRATALALRPADAVVPVAHVVADALGSLGVPGHRMRLVANGIDVERYASAHPRDPRGDRPRVLFVGGLTARKGVLDLGAASRALHDRGVDHELWVAGGVPDEGDQAHRDVVEGLPAEVRLLGAVLPEEMPEIYTSCDVFCLPSWWEAMPLTVLEAQAAGLPTVVTAVGDVPLMVDDGETGRVVPARDVPALTEALAELLRDAELRERMGRRAQESARRHDERDTITSLARLFDELLDVP